MNTHTLKALAGLLFLLLTASAGSAQDHPQRMHQGKFCYVYTVEPGNTLYGIARQFQADVDAILALNPEAAQGLSIGQIVYVPMESIDKRAVKKADTKLDGGYILHTVQRRETMFSIAKSYNVPLNALMEANPEAAESLSIGAVLRVPTYQMQGIDAPLVEPARNDSFMVHQVQSGETLYSLTKTYRVSEDSLRRFNPILSEGLKVGQWLLIPRYTDAWKQRQAETRPAAPVRRTRESTYNIALLLPFELYRRDSLKVHLSTGKQLPLLTEISTDFYRGVRMALDSLSKLGLSANVHVYDVGDDVVDARQALKQLDLNNIDLVIGPLHKGSLAVISEACKASGTYLIAPNTFSNDVIQSNPRLYKAGAGRETILRQMATFIASAHRRHNVLVVSSERQQDAAMRSAFVRHYNAALATHPNTYADSARVITRRSLDGDNARNVLVKGTTNILVVPSNEPAFVSDFITRLSRLRADGYDIQIYGTDEWLGFENIDLEYKNRFRLRIPLAHHVDYTRANTIAFLRAYRQRYGTEPNRMHYGFMGFDLAMLFGKALLDHGPSFGESLTKTRYDGTAGLYQWGRGRGSEFENKAVSIVEYNNFDLIRVN